LGLQLFYFTLKIFRKMSKRDKKIDALFCKWRNVFEMKAKKMYCIKCLGRLSLQKNLREFRCTRNKCRRIFPVTTNNLFYRSNLDLDDFLIIIDLILNNSSNKVIKSRINIDKKTIRRIKKRITELLIKDFNERKIMIGGVDTIVEIDETKMGKRKYNKGHRVAGIWVVGMVERTSQRKIVLIPVNKRDSNSLISLIKQYVLPGSIIYTDGWRGYARLSEYNYQHFIVNHSKNFVDPITNIHTNTIEGNWSSLKSEIPKRYRTKGLIDLYLLIYMLKRNINGDIFEYLLNLL
jgi:transposase-like protein